MYFNVTQCYTYLFLQDSYSFWHQRKNFHLVWLKRMLWFYDPWAKHSHFFEWYQDLILMFVSEKNIFLMILILFAIKFSPQKKTGCISLLVKNKSYLPARYGNISSMITFLWSDNQNQLMVVYELVNRWIPATWDDNS